MNFIIKVITNFIKKFILEIEHLKSVDISKLTFKYTSIRKRNFLYTSWDHYCFQFSSYILESPYVYSIWASIVSGYTARIINIITKVLPHMKYGVSYLISASILGVSVVLWSYFSVQLIYTLMGIVFLWSPELHMQYTQLKEASVDLFEDAYFFCSSLIISFSSFMIAVIVYRLHPELSKRLFQVVKNRYMAIFENPLPSTKKEGYAEYVTPREEIYLGSVENDGPIPFLGVILFFLACVLSGQGKALSENIIILESPLIPLVDNLITLDYCDLFLNLIILVLFWGVKLLDSKMGSKINMLIKIYLPPPIKSK